MNPILIKKLLEIPELQEFIVFLTKEANKLNDISDIKLNGAEEIAIEVKARKRASETITRILSPLINYQEIKPNFSNQEYIV